MTPDHTSGLRSPQMGPQLRPGTVFHSQNYVFMTSLYHATILHVPKQDARRSKNDLFGTFLAGFLMIFSKGNAWNSVSHQPLDLFPCMGYHLKPNLVVANGGTHTWEHLKSTPILGVR